MKQVTATAALLLAIIFTSAQSYLGKSKAEINAVNKDCEAIGKYEKMLAFKCNSVKMVFYFAPNDSTCDMYALDIDSKTTPDTIQKLLSNGFKKTGVKYIEPFLVSKKSTNHQKFPSTSYSNGKVEYFVMPVSLNGKSAEQNAIITRWVKATVNR